MYILPTPTHLEVVALGDSSDISPDQHLNYASNLCSPGPTPYISYNQLNTRAEGRRRSAEQRFAWQEAARARGLAWDERGADSSDFDEPQGAHRHH